MLIDDSPVSRNPMSRLELIHELVRTAIRPMGLAINIGCKETRMGDVNLDITGSPELKGTVLDLPFKQDAFSLAILSEVLEHVPRSKEIQALREICRIVKSNGVLIISTPSSQGPWGKIYWLADPAFWLIDHRHYEEATLLRLLHSSGFKVEMLARRGGPGDLLFSLVTPILYILRKLGYSYNPDFHSDYSIESPSRGYTLVVQARKISPVNAPSSVRSPGQEGEVREIDRPSGGQEKHAHF